jgi:hypothetical protein
METGVSVTNVTSSRGAVGEVILDGTEPDPVACPFANLRLLRPAAHCAEGFVETA